MPAIYQTPPDIQALKYAARIMGELPHFSYGPQKESVVEYYNARLKYAGGKAKELAR